MAGAVLCALGSAVFVAGDYFVNLEVQILWQAPRFVDLEMQILWQALPGADLLRFASGGFAHPTSMLAVAAHGGSIAEVVLTPIVTTNVRTFWMMFSPHMA